MQKVISVFGSARPGPGDEAYIQAYLVGQVLANAGFTVATGGYSGTMAAVSQGAAEAGGHVIGVTSGVIERFRPMKANQWVTEEVWYDNLRDRLLHLVTHNHGMVVLPGGIGTLSELTLAWSFLQVKEIEPRPLVLFGGLWREMLGAFLTPEYVSDSHVQLLSFADTPAEIIRVLQQWQI